MGTILSFDKLVAGIQKRASVKNADSTVPEKDERESSTSIPKDPDGATKKTVGLENDTNADTTKSFTVTPAKTVVGEEKPASALAQQAQKVAAGIRNLSAMLKKQGEDAGSKLPVMPPNTDSNAGTTANGAAKPVTGGVSKPANPDANAKTATGDPATKAKTDVGEQKTVSLPAGDSKGSLPKSQTNSDVTKANGETKAESAETAAAAGKEANAADNLVIDSSFHVKLASLILSTEEGRQYAQAVIERAHGAEAAMDIIKAATIMEERALELTQMEEQGAQEADDFWKSASETDRQRIVKLAQVHSQARDMYATELEKLAYDAGAQAAAQMGDAGILGGAGGGADPGAEAGVGAPPGAEGGMPPGAEGGMPGGEGEISPEVIVQALDQMVQSGEITPEIAAEIVSALQGGGGAGGADPGMAGGMPPGAEAGGMMPPGADPGAAAGPDGSAAHEASETPKAEKKEHAEGKEKPDEKKEANYFLKSAQDLAARYLAQNKAA